jgi:hypothetical protein
LAGMTLGWTVATQLLSTEMNRNRTMLTLVAVVLAVAGCGGDDVASSDARAEPTHTPTATATATATSEAAPEPTPKRGKCDEVKYTPTDPSESTHPDSNFYAPDAPSLPTKPDLDELLLYDNAVVVTYAANAGKRTRDRLYDWTYEDVRKRTPIVVPDSSPDALPVRAQIATVELRCNGIDWKRLTAFANRTDIAPRPRTAHG